MNEPSKLINPDQERRYLTDAAFHARVDVVSHGLWEAVSRFDLGHKRPFPYDRLEAITKRDLLGYAMAAVEALETAGLCVFRGPGDELAEAVEQATALGRTRTHAFHSLPAALHRYRERVGGQDA